MVSWLKIKLRTAIPGKKLFKIKVILQLASLTKFDLAAQPLPWRENPKIKQSEQLTAAHFKIKRKKKNTL